MSDYVIELENVYKKYKLYSKPADRVKEAINIWGRSYHSEFYALNDVTLKVKRGETLGIIGKNGSGKSTLLKIITGVLNQTNGKKEVRGQISALLELGTGFNPEYTGIENIYLNGTMRGISREEMSKKIGEILEFADIGDFINQPVKTYSSGMFARLAFSVMISFKPEILIVDEALSVGDVFFQQKCNRYMKEEMGDITKLLVTHDLSSIASMADRAIVLSHGRVVFEGEPLKAIEFYTKSVHSEVFRSTVSTDKTTVPTVNNYSVPSNWMPVEEDSLGGAQEIKIKAVNFTVNDEEYKGYISANDKLNINILVESTKVTSEIIIGYLVNDKYGNAIFGENTIGSNLEIGSVLANKPYTIGFQINWPEIQENEYFVTIGIGEGFHEMQHTIQCWAHNIIHLKNIELTTIHAIFNNKINYISIEEC
ncbi:ABC transporter ATP-binding protein [Paenibacillus sp. BR1-192]|uniref:ABC transporter ATP-binding protein n=1 Tax=Paenibacillus sp. BR1-192 TaxID=3032287 RepID=UPI00240D8459|nr:ABC transporter ATP-binding protein [Paenibacillus sp. BR1-192]WFB58117.1 ABC transporter ATP-binding protein [Paenibacillus sp. BR1-192]